MSNISIIPADYKYVIRVSDDHEMSDVWKWLVLNCGPLFPVENRLWITDIIDQSIGFKHESDLLIFKLAFV